MDIDAALRKMTPEEKIAVCDGQNFWMTREAAGLPAVLMCDGPHGLRRQNMENGGAADMLGINRSLPATCFPAAVTSGASWDPSLMERIGEAIGAEARACGADLVLGPAANIKRSPLCGRSFEYFSEDPVVSGKMAAGFIRGLQKNGTGACLKHFACNNQEGSRFVSDSILDERTLREIYLTGFEIAVKEGKPAAVMCSYNKINGVHASDSRRLLTDVLRDEWGFDGLVVTDWGAMNDRVAGFRAGCDLNMPGGSNYMGSACAKALHAGKLSGEDVDRCARRVLALAERAAEARKEKSGFDRQAHHALAREAAESGAVLLKNNGVLPFRKGQRIALIGAMARTPRYQGAGSSHVNPFNVVSPCDAMPDAVYAMGCSESGDTTDELIAEAAAAAKSADAAVIFAGLPDRYESEGFDRETMKMPDGHVRMIEAIAAANPSTAVVLCCGSAVECPWADKVGAILYMGLGGQAMGEAAANLLYGRVNPSGRLTESWPYQYEDCVCASYFGAKDAQYREGVYVGYRYYDAAGVPVRWPFGHGLCYTAFAYSDLSIDRMTVTVSVANAGSIPGAEVVMLFVAPPAGSGYRPVRELKAFRKVFLQAGEKKAVAFRLTDRAFAVWDSGWKTAAGTYQVQIGGLTAEMRVEGEEVSLRRGDWYDAPDGAPTQEAWETMLGRRYCEQIPVKGQYTMDNTLMEMKDHSLLMKIMYWSVKAVIGRGFPKEQRNMDCPEYKTLLLSSAGGPLRVMQISGGMKDGLFRWILKIANGHVIRGIFRGSPPRSLRQNGSRPK